MSNRTFRYILGYLIGGSVFVVLLPYGLLVLSRSLDHLIPAQPLRSSVLRYVVAATLAAVALLFAVWSNVVQGIRGEGGPLAVGNLEVSPRTRHLIVVGPYRCTRNPMLFGTCLLYLAVAVYLNSVVALLAVIVFTIVMLSFVKWIEEPGLCEQFGDDYREYRRRTSMFLPWPSAVRTRR